MALFGLGKKKDAGDTGGGTVTLSDGRAHAIARRIDCLGDSCPRPQLMTRKAMGEAAVGDVLEVALDNPSSVEALPPMCPEIGATHLETVKADHCWRVYLRKD